MENQRLAHAEALPRPVDGSGEIGAAGRTRPTSAHRIQRPENQLLRRAKQEHDVIIPHIDDLGRPLRSIPRPCAPPSDFPNRMNLVI